MGNVVLPTAATLTAALLIQYTRVQNWNTIVQNTDVTSNEGMCVCVCVNRHYTWSCANVKLGLSKLRACLKPIATAVTTDIHTLNPLLSCWTSGDREGESQRERERERAKDVNS